MNPIWTLAGLINGVPANNLQLIIEECDNRTKTRFADWIVSNAKDDVDLTDVRTKAEKAFDWWNE